MIVSFEPKSLLKSWEKQHHEGFFKNVNMKKKIPAN